MKTIVSTSLISFLILSVVLGVFGFCFSHFMMSGLQTPADILEEAVLYLRVYFVGFPFLFMYNILSTMFTSIGESKIPLGLLIFSSILNGGWSWSGGVWCSPCDLDRTRSFCRVFVFDLSVSDAAIQELL